MLNFYPKMMGYSGGGGGGGGSGGGGGGAGSGGAGGGTGGGTGGAAVGTGVGGLKTNNICGEGGRNALNGSVFFTGRGTTSYLLVGSAGDHNYLHDGTEDYSVEFWIFPTQSNDRQTVFSTGGNSDSTGFACRIMEDGASGGSNGTKVFCQFSRGADGNYLGFLGGTVDINSWSHVALQFTTSNKQLKIYVNGRLTNSSDLDGTAGGTFGSGNFSSSNSTYAFTVGREPYGDTLYLDGGFISNLRICRGHIIYSSNFTPPTSPLTAHFSNSTDKTTILCCQNSDDPTEENSVSVPGESLPKTILAFGGSFQTGSKNILKNADFSDGTAEFIGDSGASISASGGVMTVTNGGGDNLYALKQNSCLRIGGKYRCTATVTPTFASGNPVFRVRFGGSAVSFTQQQSTMSTGVAVRIDTGEKVADGTDFEIGSGVSSGITQFTITDLVVTAIDPPIPPKINPPFGTDDGVTFGGAIAMNSSSYMYFPTGTTKERGRGRALWAGGDNPGGGDTNLIDFIQIQSGGIASDFGDLSVSANQARGVSSSIRGVFGGGRRPHPSTVNIIDFVTIATTANAQDFGDLTDDRAATGEISSSTRGIFAAGFSTPVNTNTIDFITIATTGNAQDFGDTTIIGNAMAGTQSTTRGILAGAYLPSSPNATNVIQFLTIATTGNAQDFGDLTDSRHSPSGTSNGVRAVFMGGDHLSPAADNTIDFITIASTGNATDFGDLGSFSIGSGGATSDKIRGVFGTGYNGSNYLNVIQQVTIATTGNSVDIGELTLLRHQPACLGDAHGGL